MGKRDRPRPLDREAELLKVYDAIPRIECKGKCWDSCSSLDLSEQETRRIQQRHGIEIRQHNPLRADNRGRLCPALSMFRQCRVYDDRPFICRLWGAVPSMKCNFGCIPEGGLLTEEQGHLLMARVYELAGDHSTAAELRAAWADPQKAAMLVAIQRAQRGAQEFARQVEQARAEATGTALYVLGPGRLTRQKTEQCG